MATAWPQVEDLTALGKAVEQQIADVPVPAGVPFKSVEVTEDATGDPAFYIYYSLFEEFSGAAVEKKARELVDLRGAVMERVFPMRTGRFPYVKFVSER